MKRICPLSLARLILIFLSVAGITSAFTEAQDNIISSLSKTIQLRHWQIAKDIAPKYPLLTLPDSSWLWFGHSLATDKYAEGNWLLKTNIVIDDSVSNKVILGLFPINFITAYEIYWDGIKIGQNGIIGINKTDEKAGTFNYNLPLPQQPVTKGKHTLTVRISNHHNYSSWKWFYGGVLIGQYDTVLEKIYRSNYQAFFIIGILFIPFLFNLFLYFARKSRPEHLLFSLICFIVILDSGTILAPNFIETPTTYVHLELFTWQIITVLFTALFPSFFIYLFSFSKKIIWVIIVTDLIIYLFFTNIVSVFAVMSPAVLIMSSMITLWALYKRREESIIIFIGLIVAWAAYYFDFAFAGLATTMVICTSISIARQFARKEKTEREAQLRSAHFENELLKKNINPHFILNTLTSIIVWLRKDPTSAIKLIETLADEFRMVNQISTLKLIPIQQEINLCKSHLKIMNYRKGADYKMEAVNIVEEESVPPMIFHTLIENGLTHGYENKIQGTFTLLRRKNSDSVQYILSNDGDFSSDEQKKSTGFGIKYIKSQLEESYPGRWELLSQRQEQGWETIIEIKEK
ncbi:MAG: histidine kinase [Ignavibacteria bacterium]|nr:histidine kinase [Ignavibacteria bacterium]